MGSGSEAKKVEFFGIPLTSVINSLLSRQVISLSEKGGLFGFCLALMMDW